MKRLLVPVLLLTLSVYAGGVASFRAEVSEDWFSIRGYVEQNFVELGSFSVQAGSSVYFTGEEVRISPYLSARYTGESWSLTLGYYPGMKALFLAGVFVW